MSGFSDRFKAFFGIGKKKGDAHAHKCHKCGQEEAIFRKFADGKVICIDCASGRPKNAAS
jgi:ribosomal protein S27E